MIEEIEQALAAHSYDEVADSLKSWGFDIPSGSLKQYVNAYRRSREPQKPGSIRNRSTAKKKKNVTEKPQVTTATADSEEAITGDVEGTAQVVNESESFTIDQTESVVPSVVKAQPTIKYVFKDAKGATPINRKVHAITEDEPTSGRWHSPALCGEQPKAGTWGWSTCDPSDLSCSKCSAKMKTLQP